jgi:hypothetical protein
MSHPNALLPPRGRLRLARCVVDDGWPLRRAAERFQVSVPTASRWAHRDREHGEHGMLDRSSRPIPHRGAPRRASSGGSSGSGQQAVGAGEDRLPARPSSLHRAPGPGTLQAAKLSWLDRATGRVIRRYEHTAPGEVSWCMWTSRNSVGSPTVAGTG